MYKARAQSILRQTQQAGNINCYGLITIHNHAHNHTIQPYTLQTPEIRENACVLLLCVQGGLMKSSPLRRVSSMIVCGCSSACREAWMKFAAREGSGAQAYVRFANMLITDATYLLVSSGPSLGFRI